MNKRTRQFLKRKYKGWKDGSAIEKKEGGEREGGREGGFVPLPENLSIDACTLKLKKKKALPTKKKIQISNKYIRGGVVLVLFVSVFFFTPPRQGFTFLCFLSTGMKGMHHHA